MSSVLTLEALKAIAASGPQLECHPVPVYEFGPGTVAWIAELGADERDARTDLAWLEHKKALDQEDNVGFRAFAAAACWCSGRERVFVCQDAKAIAEAAVILGKKSGKAVSRMFAKADELNAFSGEEVEEIQKNSPQSEDGNST